MTRLWTRLDRVRRVPVVWIAAPPGAGKTTLIASYLEARRIASVWYRVDDGDGDIATFFHYLRLAIQQAAPRARLPAYTPEHAAAIGQFARRFFRAAWTGLGKRVLVFDNYQDAPPRSPFQDVMRAALCELPRGASVLVASRNLPPAALARLRAEEVISVLPSAELKLTRRETAGLARARGARLTAVEAERLHRSTDGWAAGIVLMLAGGRDGEATRAKVQAPKELLEYFAGEILDRMPDKARRVLLETALLPRVPGEVAVRLTGDPTARKVLAELARAGHFTFRMEHHDEVYDYHPLFRQFLLERGEEVLEPERRRQIQSEAARMLAAAGDADSAVDLLCAANAWDELARLIVARAPELASQARLQTLAAWITLLPQEISDREPWLLYWRGQSCIVATPGEARRHLEMAFQLFFDGGDSAGSYLAWSSITYSHLCEWGDFRPLDRWIRIFEELRRRWPQAPSPAIEASVVGGMFTALIYRQPGHPDVEWWRERARSVALGAEDIRLRRTVGAALTQFETWRPSYGNARALVDALAPPASHADSDPATVLYWLLSRAATEALVGGSTASVRAAEEGLALADRSGLRTSWTAILCMQAIWGYLSLDDLQGARAALRKMDAALDRRARVMEATYEAMASLVVRRMGDCAKAVEHAERARDLAVTSGGPLHVGLAEAALAAAQLDLGRPELAREVALGRYAHPPYWGTVTSAIAALAAFDALQRGDEELAVVFLRRSFGIGASGGMTANTLLSHPQLAELCRFALDREIEPAHARNVILSYRLAAPEHAGGRWPWALRVKTLGTFEVEHQGTALRFGRKAPRKPLEILQLLVGLGPGPVSESQVADMLWPDADGDAARHALETALYRFRKLLPDALLQRDHKLSLDLRRCWVDVDATESLARRATALATSPYQVPDPVVELAGEALALYQGLFVPGEELRPWIPRRRERVRRAVRRMVSLAAERLRANGCGDAARELEERAARADPELEGRLTLVSA